MRGFTTGWRRTTTRRLGLTYGLRHSATHWSAAMAQVNMSALQPFPEASAAHRYSVYGLSLSSDFPLPELHEYEGSGDADVEIRIGHVPADDLGEGLSFGSDGALLRVAGVASYLIRDGRQIVVEPHPNAADRNVRL